MISVAVALAAGLGLTPTGRAADNRGFLYGTVETASGTTYHGLLRWGTEESFWDDHFNSSKDELPYFEYLPPEQRKQRKKIEIFGISIGYRWDDYHASRMFIARFGDIEQIRIQGRSRTELLMRSGSVIQVDGGSNDIGGKVTVLDPSLGEVKLEWKNIDTITFEPTPRGADPGVSRMAGKVTTRRGIFNGFIQWDSQECVSTDEIDGDSRDGSMSIQMGKIRAIEKRNRDGAWIELEDGRRILLEDTNDVDHSIRGILVEDPRYGRVEIPWDVFERVDFAPPDGSGRGYRDYPKTGPLHGKVTGVDGKSWEGRIVFDLDEEEGWEMLNGTRDQIEYSIPFSRVRSIEPKSWSSSRVVLDSGEELVLEEGQDVSEDNDGVLVLRDGKDPVYLAWTDVERIEFE